MVFLVLFFGGGDTEAFDIREHCSCAPGYKITFLSRAHKHTL